MKKNINLSVYFTFIVSFSAYAEIVTDGTTGSVVAHTLPPTVAGGRNFEIPQQLGTPIAGNLFHSFRTFDINSRETATFTSVDAFQNVISRVTGGSPSSIDGLLKSTIAGANFYFINPAGVTFGTHAVIDVPAAFHVSTAQKLNFGSAFFDTGIGATAPPSTLTIAEPTSFGFLGTPADNKALIEIHGATLNAGYGKTLDVVAGNISIADDAKLVAAAGEVRLVAIQGAASVSLVKNSDGILPLPAASPTANNAGNITVNSITEEIGNIDTSGDGGGRIALWGGTTSLINASLFADNSGSTNATPAKGVDIRVYSLNLDNSIISFDTYSNDSPNIEGNSADVVVKVESSDFLNIFNGSSIKANTYTDGNAANVLVSANTLNIDRKNASNSTGVLSQANNADGGIKGNAGNVTVNAKTLNILNGGIIFSSTMTEGNAGKVTVTATDTLTIQDQSLTGLKTGIFSDASDTSIGGNAGDVSVNLTNGTLSILNGGSISSSTYAKGNAGKVSVNLTNGTLDILNGGLISTHAFSEGNAGDVLVTGINNLTIDNDHSATQKTGIVSQAEIDSSGRAGNITVQAKTLDINNGGQISSSTFATGDAGSVTVNADNSLIINSQNASGLTGIYSLTQPNSTGNANPVTVTTGKLDILNGGVIESSTYGKGNAATITVTVDNLLTIDSFSGLRTGIFSDAQPNSEGAARTVSVKAQMLDILRGGLISSSTYSQGDAGKVSVTVADTLNVDGKGFSYINEDNFYSGVTGINSQAEKGSRGQASNVTIHAKTMNIRNGGDVSSSTFAQGNSGNVLVTANSLTINSDGFSHWGTGVFSQANSESVGNAGDVTIDAVDTINIVEKGIVSSAARGSGTAGSVTVTAPTLMINNASISAAATSNSSGKTGDVTVTASKSLQLANQATISIQNDATVSDSGTIKAGVVTVSAPDIDLKDSKITAESTGNVDAGNIVTQFSHSLTMDSSFITTSANSGNGGAITINGNGVIHLQNSGFLTSVADANGNGGNINVTARALIMDTGVIQANAKGGKGGDINLQLQSLIPSNDKLIKGGAQVVWQPFLSGFNVIQAASQNGLNGTINISSPQFSISGSTGDLDGAINLPILDSNPCLSSAAFTSSLARTGKGGVATNEAKTVFVPAIPEQTHSTAQKSILSNALTLSANQPCAAFSANTAIE